MVMARLKRGVIDHAVNPRPSIIAVSSNRYNHGPLLQGGVACACTDDVAVFGD